MARIARDLPPYLRTPISFDQAVAVLRDRLANREANFLHFIERAIFGHPGSPYLPMLNRAGCGLEDISRSVRTLGLVPTLRALRDAGVYVAYEEMKGRRPIVRDGREYAVRPEAFDNPLLRHHFDAESGGTTGPGSRSPLDVAHQATVAPYFAVSLAADGVFDSPAAVWRGILPDASGINSVLRLTMCGRPPARWFSQLDPRALQLSRLKTDVATRMIVAVGRLSGASLPWPEFVPIERAEIVARWAIDALREHGSCLILTQVSRALRVCLAAQEMGARLDGALFWVGGEPPTPAKVRQIVATGARCRPGYAFAEAGGRVGSGCAHPTGPNDLHLHADTFAVYSAPRDISLIGETVPAFYFTTLLPTVPKVMLNAENDDYGVIETRSCGCLFEEIGFTEHVRDIHSFSKLTGEGVTLVASDMVAILEEALPSRFGGSALDYQLVEEEDEQGFTRLSLLISPHVPIRDEQEVIDALWQALRATSVGADQARDMWQRAGSLRIRRDSPIWTNRGKLMPLHLARRRPQPSSGD